MSTWTDAWFRFRGWRERRRSLLRMDQEQALAREAARIRAAFAAAEEGSQAIEVRWGLAADAARIAELLELNGMPRWVAFEERFVVAERDGKVLGALRYRTESKRLLLGLLSVDPWAGERRLARALYAGAGELVRELGVGVVLARTYSHVTDYPREAGYRRRSRREWRLDVAQSEEARGEPVAGRWRRLFGLFGVPAVPFLGLLRKQG
ncbi:MAG: hypothetical protein M3R38_35340 [Actinomycetota bacterium]|nr:hypothetical protein [Actinomycetota bacterium]